MAKISAVNKNRKRQKLVEKFYAKRKMLKNKIYDKKISLEERFALVVKLSQVVRNSAPSRVRNRCNLTGRPRGFIRRFALSRNSMRELAGQGFLPGVVKASW